MLGRCDKLLATLAEIPDSCIYRGYYGPNYELNIRTTNMENRNEEKYIESIVYVCRS